MKKALENRIEKFLAVKVESGPGGGWAPATYDEMHKLYDILTDIIAAKYERDADGDLPIEVILVNRCKTYSLNYDPLEYLHCGDEAPSLKEIHEVLGTARMNLCMAQDDVESTLKQLDWYVRDNERSEET